MPVRHVVPHGTSGGCASHAVMGEMTRDTADDRALDATTRLRSSRSKRENRRKSKRG